MIYDNANVNYSLINIILIYYCFMIIIYFLSLTYQISGLELNNLFKVFEWF